MYLYILHVFSKIKIFDVECLVEMEGIAPSSDVSEILVDPIHPHKK